MRVDLVLDLAHALKRTTGRGEALLALGVAPGALAASSDRPMAVDGIVIAAYDDGGISLAASLYKLRPRHQAGSCGP